MKQPRKNSAGCSCRGGIRIEMTQKLTMKKAVFLFLILLLSACSAQPTPESTPTDSLPYAITPADNPNAPQPNDVNLQKGGVVLISLNLAEQTESTPVRVKLNLLGSLPRTCDKLRMEVADPNEQYQIFVNVYSLGNLKVKCENVFQQFEASILLGVYSAGRYTVWVNGGLIGDFVTY